jgi:hypothetical protein
MWIDNSYNLNETEFGHRDTAMSDTSAMQDFCNSVRDTAETMYSIRDLKELQATTTKAISQVVGSQMAMAANTDSHLELISQINAGVKDMSAGLQTPSRKALPETRRRQTMNLHPRIDSITTGLVAEYLTALEYDLEPFERLIDHIETDLQRYRERCEGG